MKQLAAFDIDCLYVGTNFLSHSQLATSTSNLFMDLCLQCRRPGLDPWLGRSLEEGRATHSSILAWEIPWTEELWVT